jgi:hypothetical protein
MKSILAVVAAALALFGMCRIGVAQEEVTVAMRNSDAVARKLFAQLAEAHTGNPVPPDRFWAYEVDFNLDGFSEIYGFIDQPGCDGTKCGLFLFVLQGDAYQEMLGELPGARLADPTKAALGSFKRNGFLDLQLDDKLYSWEGKRYVEASTFPVSELDGTAYLEACARANPEDAKPVDAVNGSPCHCRFERFKALGLTQEQLDHAVDGDYPDAEDPDVHASMYSTVSDVVHGCRVAMGQDHWAPAYFSHGNREQTAVLEFDAFIDICKAQDWILGHRKVGTADRTLGVCGCLARALPTWGLEQKQLDLIASYYRNELSDNELDAKEPKLLEAHDAATEACLSTFPAR